MFRPPQLQTPTDTTRAQERVPTATTWQASILFVRASILLDSAARSSTCHLPLQSAARTCIHCIHFSAFPMVCGAGGMSFDCCHSHFSSSLIKYEKEMEKYASMQGGCGSAEMRQSGAYLFLASAHIARVLCRTRAVRNLVRSGTSAPELA